MNRFHFLPQCGDHLSPLSGGFSDDDLFGVAKDGNYKPDKGKGNIYTFIENPCVTW